MSKHVAFVNHVGQTLISELISDDKNGLKVKNPAILHVQPSQTGQLQVQLVPYIFREFVKADKRNDGVVINFSKDKVVVVEIELDEKLLDQYARIFQPIVPQSASAPSPGKPQVVKLFDE